VALVVLNCGLFRLFFYLRKKLRPLKSVVT